MLAQLAYNAVELVLLDRLPFFGPFAEDNDGAALGIDEAQESSAQRVASLAADAVVALEGPRARRISVSVPLFSCH